MTALARHPDIDRAGDDVSEWIEGRGDDAIQMKFDGEEYSAVLVNMWNPKATPHFAARYTGYGETVAQAQKQMWERVEEYRWEER